MGCDSQRSQCPDGWTLPMLCHLVTPQFQTGPEGSGGLVPFSCSSPAHPGELCFFFYGPGCHRDSGHRRVLP